MKRMKKEKMQRPVVEGRCTREEREGRDEVKASEKERERRKEEREKEKGNDYVKKM